MVVINSAAAVAYRVRDVGKVTEIPAARLGCSPTGRSREQSAAARVSSDQEDVAREAGSPQE